MSRITGPVSDETRAETSRLLCDAGLKENQQLTVKWQEGGGRRRFPLKVTEMAKALEGGGRRWTVLTDRPSEAVRARGHFKKSRSSWSAQN